MSTTKYRVNVSLPPLVEIVLKKIARRDHIATATKAALLIEHALEWEEDEIFNAIASARDRTKARFVSEDGAWK